MSKKDFCPELPELPPLVQVPCDTCVVTINDKPYRVHRGQSVWLLGLPTAREQRALWKFSSISVELDDVKGPPVHEPDPTLSDEENARRLEESVQANTKALREAYKIMDRSYEDLSRLFASRIVRWDWTDMSGNPRPPLDGTTDPFEDLCDEERYFLRQVLQGRVTADLPNDAPSTAS